MLKAINLHKTTYHYILLIYLVLNFFQTENSVKFACK